MLRLSKGFDDERKVDEAGRIVHEYRLGALDVHAYDLLFVRGSIRTGDSDAVHREEEKWEKALAGCG